MSLIIKAGKVITMDRARPVIDHGAIAVEDRDIVAVGGYEEVRRQYPSLPEHGHFDQWLLPGFFDAHHHGDLSCWGIPDMPLERFLLRLFAPPPDATVASEEIRYYATMQSAIQLIRSGVTTIVDMVYGLVDAPGLGLMPLVRAYHDLGIRAVLAPAARERFSIVHAEDPEFLRLLPRDLARDVQALGFAQSLLPMDRYIPRWEELYRDLTTPASRVQTVLAPDGALWCSDEYLRTIAKLADRYRVCIHMHHAESQREMQYGLRAFGTTLTAHLGRLGILGPNVSFAHAVWMTDADIDVCAAAGVSICHNPSSNLRLFNGVAPVRRFLERGINVAVGTDGMGVFEDPDYLAELRLAGLLQRSGDLTASPIPSGSLLGIGTLGGARAFHADHRVGTLAPGKRADVVILDGRRIGRASLPGDLSPVDAVAARAQTADVLAVLVDGQFIMRDRQILTVSEEEVRERLDALVARRRPESAHLESVVARLEPYVMKFYRNRGKGRGAEERPAS